MHGDRYIQQIREDLRFQVLNLRPDYSYPGKVKRVDVKVKGAATQDKQVTATIELEGSDLLNDGALYAYATLYNRESGAKACISFYPVNPDPATRLGLKLQANMTFNKYAPRGYWELDRIFLYDAVGNMRVQNRDSLGWKLFINNILRPPDPPVYVPESLQFWQDIGSSEGYAVPRLNVRFMATHPELISFTCVEIRTLNRTGLSLGNCVMAKVDGTSIFRSCSLRTRR
jgi:hypothetical protein